MMTTTRTRVYLYYFLALCFMGCRGCGCNLPKTYILESVVEKIPLGNNHQAQIQIEHLEKTGFGFTYKYKKHQNASRHSIRYNLKFDDRPYRKEIFEQDAVATDSMNQHRKDISLELSPDATHLLVLFEQKPIGVYHILPQGMPFTTDISPKAVKKLTAIFRKNQLEQPEKIMLDYIITHKKGLNEASKDQQYNSKYISETLNAQLSPSFFDDALLDHIGFELVDDYYAKDNRALSLAVEDNAWHKKATQKVYKYIATASRAKLPLDKTTLFNALGAVNLFNSGLSNYMDKRAIERQVLPLYPLHPFTVTLYRKQYHRTLRPKEARSIENNCRKILSDAAHRKLLSQPQNAANEAIEFLIQYRNPDNLKGFEQMMASVFTLPIMKLNLRNINGEILFPYETRFSEAEQALIVSYARQLYQKIPKDDRYKYNDLEFFIKKLDRRATKKDSTQVM